MLKTLFISFFIMMPFCTAFAQQIDPMKDTVIYFLTNNEKIVSTRDSADYIRITYPPTSTEQLFTIHEYYASGQPKFSSKSYSNQKFPYLQGKCILFYPNGKIKTVKNYEKGKQVGDVTDYFPNGKLYKTTMLHPSGSLIYKECRDSTGKVYAEDGNGEWITYNELFSRVLAHGPLSKGQFNGNWEGVLGDGERYTCVYDGGVIVSGIGYDREGKAYPFTEMEVMPAYKSGPDGFARYVTNRLVYPETAVTHNVSGSVTVSFTIKKDGSLDDFQVVKSLGYGCDEAAIMVVKFSSPWLPGKRYGIPVNTKYIIPINFKLIQRRQGIYEKF